MDKEALLLPVHIAMLIMVIGVGVFFFMIVGGVKKVIKITRKTKKKIRRIAARMKNKEDYKKNWFYII